MNLGINSKTETYNFYNVNFIFRGNIIKCKMFKFKIPLKKLHFGKILLINLFKCGNVNSHGVVYRDTRSGCR